MSKKPVVLMILDGYGLNDITEGNAIAQAATPVMDGLMSWSSYRLMSGMPFFSVFRRKTGRRSFTISMMAMPSVKPRPSCLMIRLWIRKR